MNSKITIPLAGMALIAALAGCKSSPASSAPPPSLWAKAVSSAGQQAGKDLAGTCIPVKDLNRAYFINLALHKQAAEALAAKCEIPLKNIGPFAAAVFSSASQAYLSGNHFDTPAKRDAWAQQDLLPIVKKYQGKS
jgi:hypothetical protein